MFLFVPVNDGVHVSCNRLCRCNGLSSCTIVTSYVLRYMCLINVALPLHLL